MDRNEMMSFEEMDKLEGDVDTDYENICYRIERVIHDMMETDGEVDYLLLCENSGKMTPWIPVNLSKGNSD